MTSDELYIKGARLWLKDNDVVWKGAEIVEGSLAAGKLIVRTEDGRRQDVLIVKKDGEYSTLPPMRNPDILLGENDLTSLSYLNEPEVLFNLQTRFCSHNAIYTYCGIVLVAINPYEELDIYGHDTIMAYRGHNIGDLDPHIFAVAEEAFKQLEREQQNQSIIVSGESGAGKTVSAKYAMRYFATVGGSQNETHVEKKVLASNPIMEAIGNAKTTRNDNSSRFGKYIEIDFNRDYHMIGANMCTYLLEKSRVVFQAPGERNYHILYQICAARSLPEMQCLNLGDPAGFLYTNKGDCLTVTDVDDLVCFEETRTSLTLLGINQRDMQMVFQLFAAVLHLGNVVFRISEKDSEACVISDKDPHLGHIASLLSVDRTELRKWLCRRRIVSVHETLEKSLSRNQAESARDALAKHVYARVFDYIVVQINRSLKTSTKTHRFIGVLDIYGFETFELNSFEQFCINYANEKLQQQFNQHVFKLEQEEYHRENIAWTDITFEDNQSCIDLIEAKYSILDLLDEECKMPKGTDQTWAEKLYARCKDHKHFTKPRLSNTAFVVRHFADSVEYETSGFLDKNRDTVMEEQVEVLLNSQDSFVRELFRQEDEGVMVRGKAATVAVRGTPTGPVPQPRMINTMRGTPAKSSPTGKNQHRKTVGSQFRDSLRSLMATLNATTPHYVRCIKPNDEKMNFLFDPKRAVQQLRACGVLETIRISAAGFPSRWTYQEFFARYRVLIRSKQIVRGNAEATCRLILPAVIKDEGKYQFGLTKIFFRAGQVAYLEKQRSERLLKCCVKMQKQVRGWLCRRRYLKQKGAVVCIQRVARGFIARRRVRFIRRTKAAITLQRCGRGFVARRKFLSTRRSVIAIQTRARGQFARQKADRIRNYRAAVVIQKNVRRWLAKLNYERERKLVIFLQCCTRRKRAKREFKKLKIQAKSVEHVKSLNKGLENKIISLQQRIEELLKDNNSMKQAKEQVGELQQKVVGMRALEAELKHANNKVKDLINDLQELDHLLEVQKNEKMDLEKEVDTLTNRNKEFEDTVNRENNRLKEELDRINQQMKENEKQSEVDSRQKEEQRRQLQEIDNERVAYQNLLKKNAILEQQLERLEDEMMDRKGQPYRAPSDNDLADKNQTLDYSLASTIITDNVIDYSSGEKVDMGLLLKYQNMLSQLQLKNQQLEKRLDLAEREDSPSEEPDRARDLIRLQEAEMENAKLRDDLGRMRLAAVQENDPAHAQEVMSQFGVLQEEVERRREECVQLRTILVDSTHDVQSYPPNSNEDGELALALETSKKLLRQLETDSQQDKTRFKRMEADFRAEIERLKADNDRQQKLISQNLNANPEAQTQAFMQYEITRLTGENFDLREKIEQQTDQINKLKRQLKAYVKKVKESDSDMLGDQPVVHRKETAVYLGMFEYNKEDEPYIIKYLVSDLRPQIATTLLPGLPSYILFMCIRHTDYVNDDAKVKSLLTAAINAIKRVIKKKHEDVDVTVLWLANVCRLLHNLKQYSGDKQFQTENSPTQNDQCLRNFDLSEYRQVLSDIAMWIYQGVIKLMEEKIQQLIVPAILEHEALPGVTVGNRPSGLRGRSSSTAKEPDSPIDSNRALEMLRRELTSFYLLLTSHGIDQLIIDQVFRQVFYFMCAGAMNNLLLRKDMCHWSKGMQLRYNISHVEQWARDQGMNEAHEALAPLVQASQLLQARKTDEDVASVCDMCDKMTPQQILKILNLYTPADEFEERVPVTFIRKIQSRLQERAERDGQAAALQSQLLMDTKMAFPIRFPFNPSKIRLEEISCPDVLNLHMLKRI